MKLMCYWSSTYICHTSHPHACTHYGPGWRNIVHLLCLDVLYTSMVAVSLQPTGLQAVTLYSTRSSMMGKVIVVSVTFTHVALMILLQTRYVMSGSRFVISSVNGACQERIWYESLCSLILRLKGGVSNPGRMDRRVLVYAQYSCYVSIGCVQKNYCIPWTRRVTIGLRATLILNASHCTLVPLLTTVAGTLSVVLLIPVIGSGVWTTASMPRSDMFGSATCLSSTLHSTNAPNPEQLKVAVEFRVAFTGIGGVTIPGGEVRGKWHTDKFLRPTTRRTSDNTHSRG